MPAGGTARGREEHLSLRDLKEGEKEKKIAKERKHPEVDIDELRHAVQAALKSSLARPTESRTDEDEARKDTL